MVYIDTSALVPVFIREPKSDAVLDWLEESSDPIAVSEWTLVEFASASSIKLRTGQTTRNFTRQAASRLKTFVRNHCTVAVPGRETFQRAAELAADPRLKLRAGDALHLAIAASLNVRGLVCLDEAMITSAKALGLKVIPL